jgi:hypothetical protein
MAKQIEFGTPLSATTASGAKVMMRAIGTPEPGRDFPVVWVSTEEEFERAVREGDQPDALPWPLKAITIRATD